MSRPRARRAKGRPVSRGHIGSTFLRIAEKSRLIRLNHDGAGGRKSPAGEERGSCVTASCAGGLRLGQLWGRPVDAALEPTLCADKLFRDAKEKPRR